MEHRCVFLLNLVVLYLCVGVCPSSGDPTGTRCEAVEGAPSCVCKHNGQVMDLTKIANFDGTPRFTKLPEPISGYLYDYNPCGSFTTSEGCANVQVCQTDASSNVTYAIADYGTEQMWIGKDGQPFVYYIGPNFRETYVYLTCDRSTKDPIVTTTGDSGSYFVYNFSMVSEHACFGEEPGPPIDTRCEPIPGAPSCVCKHPDGVIDLTKIANFDGTPRFTGLRDPNDLEYDYNPCAPFKVEGNCISVHVCQTYNMDHYAIADYGTEQMRIKNGTPYVYYTGPQQREVNVSLICDQAVVDPVVTTTGDFQRYYSYEFTVTSCHVCPGGCKNNIYKRTKTDEKTRY